jgi:MFS family permease
MTSPLPRNVRLFLAFRVLFNARFYYPVLAILFVDLGLTLDQYALLNVAWAGSIVAFELPLGAVSDRIGRRPLVVGAGALMVVEMAVLSFAPTGNATLLFVLFLVNRVLSGLAEAAASGADEALAYDTLLLEKRQGEWPRVLSHLQRISAAGFILATLIGAAVYDSDLLNSVGGALGLSLDLTPEDTIRFPVYLTLLMSLGALATTLWMREPGAVDGGKKSAGEVGSWRTILEAGRWIRQTRFVFAVILFALVLDSVVRLFLTLQSSYFRMIGIPEAFFGLFGAFFAALGFVSPSIAKRLLTRLPPAANFGVIAVAVLFGLAGIALTEHWTGAFFVVPLAIGWHLLSFFSSQYVNESTDSSRRATVLSFKSLAGNLAYGGVGVLYAVLYRSSGADGPVGENAALAGTLLWLPVALPLALLPLFFWARFIPRMARRIPPPDDKTPLY